MGLALSLAPCVLHVARPKFEGTVGWFLSFEGPNPILRHPHLGKPPNLCGRPLSFPLKPQTLNPELTNTFFVLFFSRGGSRRLPPSDASRDAPGSMGQALVDGARGHDLSAPGAAPGAELWCGRRWHAVGGQGPGSGGSGGVGFVFSPPGVINIPLVRCAKGC